MHCLSWAWCEYLALDRAIDAIDAIEPTGDA
jgi:hypothetical protein